MQVREPHPSLVARVLSTLLDLVIFHAALILGVWMDGQFEVLPTNWVPLRIIMVGIPLGESSFIIPYTLLIPLASFWIFGGYGIRLLRANFDAFNPILYGNMLAFVLLGIVLRFHRAIPELQDYPTMAILLSLGMSTVGTIGWRLGARAALRLQEQSQHRQINLLIVGLSGFDEETYRRITQNEFPNYNLVGYLEGAARAEFVFHGQARKLGVVSHVGQFIEEKDVEEVLVVPSALSNEEFLHVVQVCELRGVDYRLLPSYFDMVASRAQIELVNYVPLVHFGHPGITGWQARVKRLFDIVFSFAVLVCISPLCLLLMALIRLDSPGPVIFRQNRVGKGGRLFRVFKFRTMIVGAESKAPLTAENDPRITRLGHWLRRWSLDELPQFLNVLLGDMSVVGPRAVVPFVVEQFNDLERMTLNIYPGITGLAQVSGRDAVSFRDKSMLNIYYIRNYSLMLDLKIILRTIKTIFTGEGNL